MYFPVAAKALPSPMLTVPAVEAISKSVPLFGVPAKLLPLTEPVPPLCRHW